MIQLGILGHQFGTVFDRVAALGFYLCRAMFWSESIKIAQFDLCAVFESRRWGCTPAWGARFKRGSNLLCITHHNGGSVSIEDGPGCGS